MKLLVVTMESSELAYIPVNVSANFDLKDTTNPLFDFESTYIHVLAVASAITMPRLLAVRGKIKETVKSFFSSKYKSFLSLTMRRCSQNKFV